MSGISVSGLVSSSFDWQSIVDQLIAIDSKPITTLQAEETTNNNKLSALDTIKTDLTSLQTATTALSKSDLFSGRTATSATSGSTWSVSAETGTPTGNYAIAVSQVATSASLNGKSGISTSLNAAATDYDAGTNPNGIDGLTLASLPTSTAVTAGTFTVNGQQVTIALTDSLQEVFDKITAADSTVTATYDNTTDHITLTSDSEIILGATNDTSNFLSVMHLANNGTGSTSSSAKLGAASTTATLANAHLSGSFNTTAGVTAGTMTINGVSIAYNTTTDSLSTIISRINSSEAGVTAKYDSANDRVVLTNSSTGDTGLGVADVGTGTLAAALGLTTAAGATVSRGKNAIFTINDGEAITSASNTLDEDILGVTGLTVTVDSATTQTIKVAADTDAMKTAIDTFISAFNTVQSYIDTETEITKAADGSVSTATLSSNHEVEDWATKLRSLAYDQVSGLSGTISHLTSLGIDFSSTDSTLSITDSAALTKALSSSTDDVAAFFTTATTGFAAKFDAYLTNTLDSSDGALQVQVDTLNKANTSIEDQIATLTTRLTSERERLTTAFLAMQTAQSEASQQQTTLKQFLTSSSSSS